MSRPGPGAAAGSSIRLLASHWRLLWRVTRNDLAARFAGSVLGLAWVVVSPLAILAIYSVVYLFIFRLQVPGLGRTAHVLYIFAGLVPFLATGEALSTGVSSIVASRSVLASTVFPVDLVPAKAVLMSQGTLLVGLGAIVAAAAAAGTLSWTVLLTPLVVLLHALALLGLNWMISLLHVLFRDMQNLLALLLMVLLVATPIGYTPEMVPPGLRVLIVANPFAHLVLAYQKLLVLGELPSAGHWAALVGSSLGLFLGGGWFFARAKRVVLDYV